MFEAHWFGRGSQVANISSHRSPQVRLRYGFEYSQSKLDRNICVGAHSKTKEEKLGLVKLKGGNPSYLLGDSVDGTAEELNLYGRPLRSGEGPAHLKCKG